MKHCIFRYPYQFLLYFAVFGSYLTSYAQEAVPFTPRLGGGSIEVRGDIIFVGNNILNRATQANPAQANTPYNGTQNNNALWMEYIDIDGDPSTFSSSSASLTIADPACSQVRYAGLYWAATYPNERSTNSSAQFTGTPRIEDWNQIKFRIPGGAYVDLVADTAPDLPGEEDDIIFDGFDHTNINNSFKDSPYICYKDVTNLVRANTNPNGEYTVANVRATKGTRNGSSSAGWVLVVIYENPTETGKFISTFDGYAGLSGAVGAVDVNVNGFRTLPTPFPVRARVGVGALEGDRGITNDRFFIKANSNPGFTNLSTGFNPANNFFNSTITNNGLQVPNRTPFGTNTLGLDLDLFNLNNPLNAVLPNGETGATLRFTSTGDGYGSFLATFSVEIIEPEILLEKRVEDITGNDITGLGVNLGQQLDYILSFQNRGNDDAVNYTIRDVLPSNVIFVPGNLVLPPGVTFVYDAPAHAITFTVPNNLIEIGDPASKIRMRVRVAENCFDFVNACTDIIENQAFSTYRGLLNSAIITDDPSVSDFDNCGFVTPGATNFLLDDLSSCDFSRTVQLCGSNILLDAGDNFDDYIWYRDVNGNNVIDAGDTIITDGNPDNDLSTLLVTQLGTYIVDKIVADPCKGFQEIITVIPFGNTQTNPIIDLINDPTNTVEGEVVTCSIDGDLLPKIFLCGLNDTELIQINIPDALSIVWQRLDEGSCASSGDDCANKNGTCTWNQVSTGNAFLAQDAGQYRLIINYQNGCFTRFYFNVFKNPLDPQFNKTDIICATPGNITVTNMPANYEYQLLNAVNGAVLVPFSANNGPSFTITSNGAYTVEMQQQGVVGGCIFRLDNIGVLTRDFQVDITTKDTDCNGLGEISISVLNVEPQYYYQISQGGNIVDTHGPSLDNNYTFQNLSAGNYDVLATTDDGCSFTQQVTINDIPNLTASAITTKPIDCIDGIIRVTGTGGVPNPDYLYAIWSYNGVDLYPNIAAIPADQYQVENDFIFTAAQAGDYVFVVVDSNNCSAFTNTSTIGLAPNAEYTPILLPEQCFGAADGSFAINVTNSNGYSLSYTLTYPDSSTATNTSGLFTNLAQGNYSLTITQTAGGNSCDLFETFAIGGPTASLSATAVLTQPYTCILNGIIEAQTVTGGTAPYTYSIDGVNFGVPGANTFNGLTTGTYAITVRDANGCIFVTNSIVLDSLNPPTDLTFSATAPNCPTQTSNVTASVVNGNAPFMFEIIAPSAIPANSISGATANFNGLAPNTYTFRVTDAKGCTYEETFTIAPVTPIDVVGQLVSNVSCFNGSDGEALFSVARFGAGSYNYTITGPANFSGSNQTNATIPLSGLIAGNYDITVTDTVTNCTDTASVTINAPSAALSLGMNITQPTCTANGNVLLTAANGWGSYSYTITYPDGSTTFTNTTGAFGGLTATGNYTVMVEDTNGCVVTDAFIIDAVVAPVLELVPNALCYTSLVGLTLTANVISGGDGNYQYSLNGGTFSANNVFTGLAPGTHLVTVRDGKNCTDSETITINPELTVTASAAPIFACATATNVNITAAGGDGNYVYAVVVDGATPIVGDFSTTNPLSVTGAGNYDVYVRDNNGNPAFCEAQFDLIITQDAPLALNISSTPILCSGASQASISVAVSGGSAPYSYSIDNGVSYQTSNIFVNRPAGSYQIRVRDVNNCIINQSYTITEPFTLSASAAITELVECNPVDGAEVRITNAQGGTAPYTYSFNGGSTYLPNPIGFLLPGTHTVYIRDANLCVFPMTVTVEPQPTPPNLTSSLAYECDGEGTVTISADSPDFDYTYDIDGVPNTPITSNIFNNVTPGNHTFTVNYIRNTPPMQSTLLSETFGQGPNTSITEIDPAYCYEPQDGTVNSCGWAINNRIQDGEYSVTQIIANPFGSWRSPNDHSGLPNGRFLAINVGGAVGPNGIIYAKRNIEVLPNRDISISLEAFNLLRAGTSGADPDITIQLVDGGGTIIASTTTGAIPKNNNANDWQNYTVNLNPGANSNLDIVIRTNNAVTGGNDIAIDDIQAFQVPGMCSETVSIDVFVESGRAFEASIISASNISCNGLANGSITFEVENFNSINGFEYNVNGGSFSAPQTASPVTVSGLIAGPYTIEVRDVLDPSCSITLSQTLTQPNAVVAAASVITPFTCNNLGATISGSAVGGTPNYQYQLEDSLGGIIAIYQNNATFTNVPAGDYIVRVRDVNGCEDAIDTAITIVAPNNPTFTTTPTACYSGNNDGSILVDVTSLPGNGGFLFSINGGPWLVPTPSTATSYTFANLSAGTYTINVRDQFGCVGMPQNVVINPQLTANALLNNDLTCLSDAQATINANGGNGALTYEWSNDGGSTYSGTNFAGNVFTTNVAGTYVFRVTDATAPTACTVETNPVTINAAVTPVITSITPTNLLCNGDSSGSLTINIDPTVGLAPFVINVLNTTTSVNYGTQTSGLAAGDYVVTLTDAKGCSIAEPATITEPAVINYTVTDIPITCDNVVGTTNPGSITISGISGGTAEYTYYLSANNGIAPKIYTTTVGNRDHTFNILTFGIYQIDVTDANGCSAFSTQIIASPPNDLDIDVATATADCVTGGTAIVTVGAAVGSGNYEFAILETFTPPYSSSYIMPDVPGGDTATFTGLVPGITYTFVVHDLTTNCFYFETAAAPINTPSNMTASLDAIANVSCTGSADGNISFTFDNYDSGATAVNYEIFNSQSNISTGFTGTSPVNPPSGPITVANFATLPPGEYFLLLSEVGGAFNGCSVFGGDFTIRQSVNPLALNLSITKNDNCNPNAGVITATGQFGTGPYQYQILPAGSPAPTVATWTGSSQNVFNVEGGDYDVYVKDAFNCIHMQNIVLPTDPSPIIALSLIDECAPEGSYEILIDLTQAGIAPYAVSVNGSAFQNIVFNASNQYTISGLSSGLGQTVTVRDLNGCGTTQNFDIFPKPQATVSVTKLLDCTATPNAEITITASNGSGSFDYEISGPVNQPRTAIPSPANSVVWNLASTAGNYIVSVYDNNTPSCPPLTFTIDVPPAVTPLFTETHLDNSCFGANDGSITLTQIDNGLSPLTYSISPVAGTFNAATSTFENLPAGTYDITATGTNGCTTDINGIVIGEPAAIANVNASVVEFGCTAGNNTNNASITIDGAAITGGSGNYVVYEFINDGTAAIVQSGNNPTFVETNALGGNYTINVYDSNGCVGSTTAVILPFDQLLGETVAITNPLSCTPGADGEITISVNSTNSDPTRFEYSIDNGLTYQVSNIFSGLSAGTHNFLVRHLDTGCVTTASETLVSPDNLELDITVNSNVICFGSMTGEATFDLHLMGTTFNDTIVYVLYQDVNNTPVNLGDDITTTGTFPTGNFVVSNLSAGSYTIEISQSNFPACTYTESFNIAGPSAAITGTTIITEITCNPTNNGIIEITDVTGGWGGYTYYVGTTAPASVADFIASPRFENLVAGTYQAWVRDVNGCQQLIQNTIILADPTPITAVLQVNQENCTNLQGEIEVVGISGGQGNNYTYQLIKDGVPFGAPQSATIFPGLGAGSYEVAVSDQWGCAFTTTAELLFEEMNLTATVVKPLDCTTTPDGEITIFVSGGSANLDFTVTFPDGTTTLNTATGIFTGLSQVGYYTFRVTDLETTNPVCEKTIIATLDAPSVTTLAAATISNVSCNGLSDGSIRINLVPTAPGINEDPIYVFNLYDALGNLINAVPQTDPLFTGLAAGDYEVEAISGRGCASVRQNVTISEPLALAAAVSATAFSCNPSNGANTATVTALVTPGTGTAPYLFSIDNVNFQTGNTFEIVDNSLAQNITIYVRDANGCGTSAMASIAPLNRFSATVSQDLAISCTGPEAITITVNDDGNTANTYTYEVLPVGNPNALLTGNPTYNTATFDLTVVGSYTFRVTDTATGCYFDTATYTIAPFDLIEVVATATAPVICFGDANGALEINVTNVINGTYNYTVFNADGTPTTINGTGNTATNPLTITGLSGGSYFVRVSETGLPNCTEDSNIVTIVSPDMALTAIVSPLASATCDNNLGEILVDPNGGFAPYDIVLTNTTTSQSYNATNVQSFVFTGLSAGSFTISITDNNGCVLNDTETLVPAVPITAGISATPTTLTCFGDTNATVSAINIIGGQGVYQYALNLYDPTGTVIDFSGGAQLSPTFTGLGAGIYSITVSDGWNCDVETVQVTISEPFEVSASLIQVAEPTCNNQAQLLLAANGGTAPYTYSIDGITYLPMSGSNIHTFTVPSGIYQYFVRDSFGCGSIISNQISVDPIPPLTLLIDDSAAIINCNGETTASIRATATGGLGNYQYELYSDAALTNLVAGPQTTRDFTNLGTGDYYVRVVSGDCNTVSNVITITEPTPLVVTDSFTNVSCFGAEDGSITVNLSGGSGNYLYAILPNLNQFDTVNTFTDLPGSATGITYTVVAQDVNGCFEVLEYTIFAPEPVTVTATALPEICAGSEDGSISLIINGGTAPYSTSLNANNDSDFVADQTVFTNLASGTYVIFIRDAMGCETNTVVEIEAGVNLNANVTPIYECTGNIPEASIQVVLEDATIANEVMYAIDSTDPLDMVLEPNFTNIPAGDHYLAITHANGCINTIPFSIIAYDPLTLVLEQRGINEITAVATGGLQEYTFLFGDVNNGNDNTFFINRTDTYTVTVIDENGCEVSAQIFMEFIDIEIPNFFTPDGDGNNDFWKPRNQEGFPQILTIIYDRYGRVVYRMGLNDRGWDGTYNGKELPSGDYWHIIKLNGENDSREFVGHFTLYR